MLQGIPDLSTIHLSLIICISEQISIKSWGHRASAPCPCSALGQHRELKKKNQTQTTQIQKQTQKTALLGESFHWKSQYFSKHPCWSSLHAGLSQLRTALAKLTFGKVLLLICCSTDIYISWREGEAGKKIKLLCSVILII